MKFLTRFLLSLCIFLLNGYGHVFAHTHEGSTGYSEITNLEKLQASYDTQTDITSYASCYIVKLNNKTYTTDNENEENELTASKKWLELSNYFVTILSSGSHKYFSPNIKRSLLRSKHFSFLPSCKWYIMFRVIRI